jgi:hypothetical protein
LTAAALPGFHSLSGGDKTGGFAKKGKLNWWNTFMSASADTLQALADLGSSETLSEATVNKLEAPVCQLYLPNTKYKDIGEVRWWLFTKKQTQGENLPPTRESLYPAIARAHYQAMEWFQDDRQHPVLPSPTEFGWKLEKDTFVPVMCTLPCAPEAILTHAGCSCVKRRCEPPCKCRANKFRCTEMCACGGNEEMCDNMEDDISDKDESSDFEDVSDSDEDNI